MATSRTGTATWKRIRTQALRRAQRQGITQCPHCGTTLDYKNGRNPNSAWIDHITPHSRGGQDTLNNTAVLCRTCNISKGNRAAPKQQRKPLRTSRAW